MPLCLRSSRRHRRLVVQPGEAARLDEAVGNRADVANGDRAPLHAADDELGEVLGAVEAAHGAQHQLLLTLVDVPAGNLEVLRPYRGFHLLDR